MKKTFAYSRYQGTVCLLFFMLIQVRAQPVPETPIVLRDNELLVFAGGTNVANMRKDAYLETMLLAENPQKKLHVRNLGWDGDTVYEQFRDVGFRSWSGSIDSLRANVVFVQFGQMESLNGTRKLDTFISAYKNLLRTIRHDGRRIVVISPVPFEESRLENLKDNPLAHAPLEEYVNEIKKLAGAEGLRYIDVYHPLKELSKKDGLTTNGIHLTAQGQRLMASIILGELKYQQPYASKLEPLRQEIIRKNTLWFNYWRPGNWAFLYGDRMTVPFSHDWTDKNKRIFPEEMSMFEKLMENAENQIGIELKRTGAIN